MHSFSDNSAITNVATTSNSLSSSSLSASSFGSFSSGLPYSTASYGSRTISSVCSDRGNHNVHSSDSSGCTSIGSSPVPSDQGSVTSPTYQNSSQKSESSVDDAPNSEVGFAVNLSHNDITSFQSSQHQGCGNQKLPLNKRPLSSFSNNKSCDRDKEKSHNRNQNSFSSRKMAKPESFKTVMCKGWLEMGGCGFGQNCRFAHGEEELRPSKIPVDNPKYKTKLCDKYTRTGVCPYGDRCLFIHPETANSNGFANPYIHPDRMMQIMKDRAFPPMSLKRNLNSATSLITPKPIPSFGNTWLMKLAEQKKSPELTTDAAEPNATHSYENKEMDRFRTLSDITNNELSALASPLTANSFSSSKASSDSGTEFDSDLMWGFTTGIDDPFELAIKSDNIARSLAIEFAKPF